jgi:hypothetical protein
MTRLSLVLSPSMSPLSSLVPNSPPSPPSRRGPWWATTFLPYHVVISLPHPAASSPISSPPRAMYLWLWGERERLRGGKERGWEVHPCTTYWNLVFSCLCDNTQKNMNPVRKILTVYPQKNTHRNIMTEGSSLETIFLWVSHAQKNCFRPD